jgi:hypothetical protein
VLAARRGAKRSSPERGSGGARRRRCPAEPVNVSPWWSRTIETGGLHLSINGRKATHLRLRVIATPSREPEVEVALG